MQKKDNQFLVMFDRDGTLIVEKNYLSNPDEVELFPQTNSSLLALQKMGGQIAIVSNQSGVGRGYFSTSEMNAVNKRMEDDLSQAGILVSGIYCCPHAPEAGCACRKPRTQLLEKAAALSDLPLETSYMIGDKNSDIEAGKNAGAKTILVISGYGAEAHKQGCNPDWLARDLSEVVQIIGADRIVNSGTES